MDFLKMSEQRVNSWCPGTDWPPDRVSDAYDPLRDVAAL